ncbi:sphingosine N-acyltransferase lag1 [Paramarasmius palmivorus]|uniref:Sphingosine N-acyltransferase lag1 n=1 Tax=Paramarasmius palmivorus TaxID=297713 RepID=A0AAW0E691_9AGAR
MSVLTNNIEYDEKHHLTGPFMPQTPLGASTPMRTRSPVSKTPPQPPVSPWLKWAVEPVSALKVLVIPIILYVNWELLSPVLTEHVFPRLNISKDGHISNPFAPFFLLSNPVESSSPDDQRYAKSYFDLLFIAYYIVFWSLVRQVITIDLCRPLARRFGIRKEHKLDRFGEQGYAVIYFAVMGAWGYRIMKQQPTYWYQTQHFWIGESLMITILTSRVDNKP